MAVPTTQNQLFYDGNGSTSTPYPVPFPVLRAEDLFVDIQLASDPDSDWSSLTGSFTVNLFDDTAEVLTIDAISDLYTVRITRTVPYTQEAVYPVAGSFPAKSHEKALDKLAMADQQLKTEIDTHNHNGVYIRFEELAGLIPELPTTMGASTIAGNPVGSSGPALSIPVTGGLGFDDDGNFKVGGDEVWRLKDIWMAARTDGLPGTGTINDPFDASTAEKIDTILGPMSTLKVKVNIHWLPGTYLIHPVRPHEVYPHTAASPTWVWRDGWHWDGAGPGRTIWKCAPCHFVGDATGSRIMFRWSVRTGDSEFIGCGSIRGGTIDCDVHGTADPGPGVTYTNACAFEAGSFLMEDVVIENVGGRGQEIFPVEFTNGLLGDADRPSFLTMRRVEVRDAHNDGGGAGVVVYSAEPSQNLRFVMEDCRLDDCYLCLAQWQNADILNNYINVGNAGYAAINFDTGLMKNVLILGNKLLNYGYGFGQVGGVNIGTIDGVAPDIGFDNFIVAFNHFEPLDGGVFPMVRAAGGVTNLTAVFNTLKSNVTVPGFGYLRDDDVYPGGDEHYWSAGVGFPPSWHVPDEPNGDAFFFGNRVVDDGSVPLGMPDTVPGSITATGGVLARSLDITEPGGGPAALSLRRTGATPSKWVQRIPAGQTFYEIGPEGYGVDAFTLRLYITGAAELLIANAAFSADILTPRKGITGRSGAGWPVAADVPTLTGCDWFNTSTNEVRHVYNRAGTMHYGAIFSTTP